MQNITLYPIFRLRVEGTSKDSGGLFFENKTMLGKIRNLLINIIYKHMNNRPLK
jgi:hypothetical protein